MAHVDPISSHFRKLGTLLALLQVALGFAEPVDDDARGSLHWSVAEVEVEELHPRGRHLLGRNRPAGTPLASTIQSGFGTLLRRTSGRTGRLEP